MLRGEIYSGELESIRGFLLHGHGLGRGGLSGNVFSFVLSRNRGE